MKTYLSFDVGGTFIKWGVINASGEILSNGAVETPGNYQDFLDTINDIYKLSNDVSATAMAFPGVCDLSAGKVIYTPNIVYLRDKNIVNDVKAISDCHCFIANDANMAALGEYRFGQKGHIDNMVFITLGTGVGGGAVVNGMLFRGKISPFEIGHIVITVDGRLCGCGRRGCFETYCNTGSIMLEYEQLIGKPHNLTPFDIYKLAKKGNKIAKTVFDIYAYYLAQGLVNVANVFVPEIIKLGGGICEMKDVYLGKCMEHFNKMIYPAYRGLVKVEIATLKNMAGILGGAALCIEKMLDYA